jgi:aminopeptidase-like protein
MWPESTADPGALGVAMYELVRDLYPVPRSITGDGLRKTLTYLLDLIPLKLHEVPSGTPVLDWTVPREWNVREAWIQGPDGRRVVDFADSTLHLVSYSVPVRGRFSLAELRPHLHTLPDHPDWIPYRTSYYAESWGFCLTHRVLESMPEGEYEVCVDATLEPGHLTYGECVIPGRSEEEVLLSCHACHPALANDNLSGVALAVALVRDLLGRPERRYTYRFLFIPGTIGSITWLAQHEDVVPRIRHGLVLSGVGDPGGVTYKRSRRGDAEVDRAVSVALRDSGDTFEVQPFVPYGYDERQYCSPGFDLPVGCFSRTPYGRYPQYHTSADDLDFVTPEHLGDSFAKLRAVVDVMERNEVYRNLSPKGEPQLGRRGLYRPGGGAELPGYEMAILWVLNMSDGSRSLLDVAEQSSVPFPVLAKAAEDLVAAGLLALT